MNKMRVFVMMMALLFVFSACQSQKPYYKTKTGKKKQKYYNDIQFGGQKASQMKMPK
jgi:predicted component of type VI protein secretion system